MTDEHRDDGTIFLTYGRDEQGRLVHITEAGAGKGCGLRCPFCGVSLVARKGPRVAHHFVHERRVPSGYCRPTAVEVADLLPSYKGFVMGLTARQRCTLQQLLDRYGDETFRVDVTRGLWGLEWKRFLFVAAGTVTRPGVFVRAAPWPRACVCRLALAEFAALIRDEFERSGRRLWRRSGTEYNGLQPQAIAREILQQEVERSNRTALYFLEIQTGAGAIHKIGVTTRPLEERVREVQSFVCQYLPVQEITALVYLPRLGYVESYFKARFARHRLELGQATEYFCFEDPEPVLAELKQIGRVGRGFQINAVAPAARPPGSPDRPWYQARFERYTVDWNGFSQAWEMVQVFADVTVLDTDTHLGRQVLKLGKRFEALGPLLPGELVQFNATAEHGRLKNPTHITRVRSEGSPRGVGPEGLATEESHA